MADSASWMDGVDSGTKAKSNTIINFYDREVLHPGKTKEAGRPIYITKTYIHKITPGDRLIDIDRPMRPEDVEAFPAEWERYQNKQAAKIEGTPLEEWPYLNKTRVAELHAMNVLTVEHIANLSDSVGHKIMDFNDLRRRARAYLKTAADSAFSDKLKEELDAKEEQLKVQAQLIQNLNERLTALEKPKRRGRPPTKVKQDGTDPPADS